MNATLAIIAVVFALALQPTGARATTLTERADIVVVGEVISGQQTGATARFVIRVDRTLKGRLYPGALLTLQYGPLMATAAKDLAGDYGIWFLRRLGPGEWHPVPAGDTHAPLSLGLVCLPLQKGWPPPPARDNLDADDLVAIEIASAVEHFDHRGVQFYMLASRLLSSPSSAAVTSQYRRLFMSVDPQIRILGEIGLVKEGDPRAIEELPGLQDALMQSSLRIELLSGLQNIRASAPPTIKALGSVATSPAVLDGVQFAAAQALRAIHTEETLPFLAELLNSPEARIRHEGLAGLSMFVENLPIQSPELMPGNAWLKPVGPGPYRTEATDRYSAKFGERDGQQQEYVAFWKAWWETMKTRIGSRKVQPGAPER